MIGWNKDNIYLQSFNVPYLHKLNDHYKNKLKIGLLYDGYPSESFLKNEKKNCHYLCLNYEYYNLDLHTKLLSLNYELYLYTVNDKKLIDEFKKCGVNGIISDYPDI